MDYQWWNECMQRIESMTDAEFREFVDTCETQREFFVIYGKGEEFND